MRSSYLLKINTFITAGLTHIRFRKHKKSSVHPSNGIFHRTPDLGLAAARASRASLNVCSCETDGTRDDADGESDCALLDWDVGSAGFVGLTISIGILRRFDCTVAGDDTGEEDCNAVIFKACLINGQRCR